VRTWLWEGEGPFYDAWIMILVMHDGRGYGISYGGGQADQSDVDFMLNMVLPCLNPEEEMSWREFK